MSTSATTPEVNVPKSDIVIREVAKDVWTFSRPLNLFNRLPVGGRSTAIKLNDGSVWILASTPLTDETKQKLAELGQVKYIIAGNAFHHLFLKPYKDEYTGAKVIGPEDLNAKKVAEVFTASNPDAKFGFEDEIEHCFFSGYKNKDIAFYHKASKTAIGADLLFNLPGTEQYASSSASPNYPILTTGLRPSAFVMKLFIWLKEGDKTKMQNDARRVAAWDFDKYIPCHGNVIETNANQAWRSTWSRYL
ncbi:hypothetical protein NLI96_g8730 [Meripilus lineatus]|uniref:Uncharacterized protein n=1 Tax=Meripilus lineatus TaxID=2056292 RepID=A0AAD5UYF2_9APHY|nr:hypothetical protein NLI96_g8730 [Physisporinus lineatus]